MNTISQARLYKRFPDAPTLSRNSNGWRAAAVLTWPAETAHLACSILSQLNTLIVELAWSLLRFLKFSVHILLLRPLYI